MLAAIPAAAQERLTLDQALAIARAGNHAIQRSANDVRIAENNNTLGNAGYLPKLDITAGYNGALSNVNQKLTSGDIVTRSNAASNTLTSGLALTWTVFDGFRMNAERERLTALQTLAGAGKRETEETTSADVINAYYDIVQQQRVLEVAREAVMLSRDRVGNVDLKYKVGENSKRELLQAKVDLNADSSAVLRQEAVVANAKITLNQILARDRSTAFTVADSIDIDTGLDYETLRREALASNSLLQTARVAQSLAQVDLRSAKADRYPTVGVILGYNLLQNDAQTGQVASNRNLGLTYGLTASMNLYDGLNTDRETENAKIAIESSDITYTEAREQVEADLLKAYGNYRNRLDVVALEQENLALARENFSLAQERYKVGVLIPLELREAQNALVAAESRLVSARYDAKLAETELLRLSGRLAR
jgi:outer membrane protein TolC